MAHTEFVRSPFGKYYAMFYDTDSFTNAERSCAKLGGCLPMPENEFENEWIAETFSSTNLNQDNQDGAVWLGARKKSFERTFTYWRNGQPILYKCYTDQSEVHIGWALRSELALVLHCKTGIWSGVDYAVRWGVICERTELVHTASVAQQSLRIMLQEVKQINRKLEALELIAKKDKNSPNGT